MTQDASHHHLPHDDASASPTNLTQPRHPPRHRTCHPPTRREHVNHQHDAGCVPPLPTTRRHSRVTHQPDANTSPIDMTQDASHHHLPHDDAAASPTNPTQNASPTNTTQN